jgi:glyoxylase-like metal-dependent hydrolase (beta-lactamase superfamily II)
VTITRIADFQFEVPDSGVVLQFEVSGFGVRTDDRRIVIDPWIAFDQKRAEPDGASRWEHVSKELAAADLAPADVDTVVYTHLDGVGWAVGPDDVTPSFPNARHLVPASEIEAFDAGLRGGTDALDVLRAQGLVDAVEPPLEIAPGVLLEAAPGHTRQGTVVRVRQGDTDSVFVGHLFLHHLQVQNFERVVGDEDPAALIETRRRLMDESAARGTVLYGDLWESPGYGTVTKDGDSYVLQRPGV